MRGVNLVFTVGLIGFASTALGGGKPKDSVREPVAKPSTAIETPMPKKDLFVAGEDGYATYRIPGIVVTQHAAPRS